MSKELRLTLIFLLGALVGALIAILFTPWKGEDIRDRLSRDPVRKKLKRLQKKIMKIETHSYSPNIE